MAKKKKFYETDEFKKTYAEWRQKLKESGFNDIEIFDEESNDYGNLLKGFSIGSATRDTGYQRMDAAAEYYSRCTALLWEMRERGEDLEHLLLWKLHCDGLSIREINRKTGKSRKRVSKVISKYHSEVMHVLRNGSEDSYTL